MERERKKKVKGGFKMCETATSKDSAFSLDYTRAQNPSIRSKAGDGTNTAPSGKLNQVGAVMLFGVPIVSLIMDGKERLCLAQISSTLLKDFSYNEIHNRRVALGITCIQCTPVQLEILRRAGAMPVTSRRCGMITRREAERLCQSFLGDHAPPQLPENFAFEVYHECAWGCRGAFVPSRYNSSRAKCIRCSFCQLFFSPNKFIFHSHRLPDSRYIQPDAANFNSWRRHLKLCGDPPDDDCIVGSGQVSVTATAFSGSITPLHIKEMSLSQKSSDNGGMRTAQIVHAWEDVKAMFNGGTRKRLLAAHTVAPDSSPSPGKRNSHNQSISLKVSPSHYASQGNGNSSRAATPQQSRHSNYHSAQAGQNNHGQHPPENIGSTAPGFLSPISGITVPSPLLSPGSIWNPGISPVGGRQFPIGNAVPSLPLSIHPLSIPWLRRPLFPFSHPFGPTCKFLGEGATVAHESTPSTAAAMANGRPGTSAFRPVGQRSPTHNSLFTTWLTNAGIHGNASLPEDLSLNSGNSSNNSSSSPILAQHICQESGRTGKQMSAGANGCFNTSSTDDNKVEKQFNSIVNTPISKEMLVCQETKQVVSSSSSSSKSSDVPQVETVEDKSSPVRGDESSSDEENVDIESTDTEFWRAESEQKTETTSRIGLWEMENTRKGRKRSLDEMEDSDDVVDVEDDEVDSLVRAVGSAQAHSNSNQRNATGSTGSKRKKRLWDFDARCNHID